MKIMRQGVLDREDGKYKGPEAEKLALFGEEKKDQCAWKKATRRESRRDKRKEAWTDLKSKVNGFDL